MQNSGDQILVFDTRCLYDQMKSHVNYNFKSDHTVSFPSDYILENNLDVYKFADWVPNLLMKDEMLKSMDLVTDAQQTVFKNRKRMFIYIIASNSHNVDYFKIEKMFLEKYANDVFSSKTKKIGKVKDYISLRYAVLLIHALKKERIHREVYLVHDCQRQLEHKYKFLMDSHINKFVNRYDVPTPHQYHTSLKFT